VGDHQQGFLYGVIDLAGEAMSASVTADVCLTTGEEATKGLSITGLRSQDQLVSPRLKAGPSSHRLLASVPVTIQFASDHGARRAEANETAQRQHGADHTRTDSQGRCVPVHHGKGESRHTENKAQHPFPVRYVFGVKYGGILLHPARMLAAVTR
jgi:hypothetical protein